MTWFCKTEIYFGLNRIRTKKPKPKPKTKRLNSNAMSGSTNTLLNEVGIYTDLINLVNDYTVGENSYWKGKYKVVVSQMNHVSKRKPPHDSDTLPTSLGQIIGRMTRKKIRCVINQYVESINNNNKTATVWELFRRYRVVGIHRVVFDNLVFKLKQMIKVKNYKVYKFKSNIGSNFDLKITPKLLRHLNDYNHSEYECYTNTDESKLWMTRMCWGSRETQQLKRKLCGEIKSLQSKKQEWVKIKKQETENTFLVGYNLAHNIKILHVNQKSVRVSINAFDGKPVQVTKVVGKDKKTDRFYICNPILKKRRIYADEKYLHCPEKMFTLYKNM